MLITVPCVVSLTWTLADGQGQHIDTLDDPVEFFFGGDDLLPKLEEVLAGKTAGFETHLYLEPEHAFGDYHSELVCFEDRSLFPAGIAQGMQFDGLPEGAQSVGMPLETIYTLAEIYPSHVVLDGNHPLAGMALQLQLKVVAVRQASSEEQEAKSVAEGAVSLLSALPASQQLH